MPTLKTQTEQELITAYQAGENHAMDELVKRNYKKVYTALYMLVKDKYIAEDLLQETFIKAMAQIKACNYANEGKFSAWVARVAHNLCMDYFRVAKRNVKVTLPDGRDIFDYIKILEENTEDKLMKLQSGSRVKQMLELIPQEQREVVVMRLYANMSFAEIAEETGVTLNTALGRMRYGLLNLRKLVQEKQLVL
jgi:RNA polymerase sigma factor (sigma-70 family)